MAFKLMTEEKQYLDILKETKMLRHVGKGPVDPAPKEKEAKTSTDPGTGEGTVQAATVSPNKIPTVRDLARQLAKEGVDIREITLDELYEMLTPEEEPQKREITQEEVDYVVNGGVENEIKDILEQRKCRACGCNPCKCD